MHLLVVNIKVSFLQSGYAGSGVSGKSNPAYETVRNHYRVIFCTSAASHKSYVNMPFFDDWNPDKGGEFWRGAKWILDNLGPRPEGTWQMDVIEHAKGFIPGNLRWAQLKTQSKNKQHRWLGDVSDEEFAVEALRRGYRR